MNWFAHSFLSVFLAILVIIGYAWFYNPTIDLTFFISCLIFVAASAIGALFPDLDLPDSKFNQILEAVVAIVIAIGAIITFGITQQALIYGAGAYILFKVIYALIVPRHRGFVHSLIFMSAVTAGIFIITKSIPISAGFLWGFMTHMLFDGCALKVV